MKIPLKDLEHILAYDNDCQRCTHEDHYDDEEGIGINPEDCTIHQKYVELCYPLSKK